MLGINNEQPVDDDDIEDYTLDIFGAIESIRDIEGEDVIISIPIPNKLYRYLRFKEYPYNAPMFEVKGIINGQFSEIAFQFQMKKIFELRIEPYLASGKLKGGNRYE